MWQGFANVILMVAAAQGRGHWLFLTGDLRTLAMGCIENR